MTDFNVKMKGILEAAAQLKAGGSRLTKAIDLSVRQQAELMRADIIQGITRQAPAGKQFKGLSRLTLAIRKLRGFHGTKILIQSATLRNSVKVHKAAPGAYFVGILRGARGAGGRYVSEIATMQEFGHTYVVRITPKMRAFLMKAMRLARMLRHRDPGQAGFKGSLGKKVMTVKIPARPFIGPVVDAARREPTKIQRQLAERTARNLGYKLGGGH